MRYTLKSLKAFALFATIVLVAVSFHPALDPFWDIVFSEDEDYILSLFETAGASEQTYQQYPTLNQTILFSQIQRLINETPSDQKIDTDNDGLYDSVEIIIGTDYNNSDTDFDGLNDSFEVFNSLDPLKTDSNDDGLTDYFEITNVSSDFDNDGIENQWDIDNDNDGVNDATDLSPFSKTEDMDSISFNAKTNGNPTYVNFQLRPKDPNHLRLTQQVWDWPEDEEGFMKDLNESQDDVYITPMLELSTSVDFKIIANHSGKCLEVSDESMDDNATIIQNTFSSDDHQLWRILPDTLGYYKIESLHSGKYLTAQLYNNSVYIIQSNFTQNDSQLWRLDVKDDGIYSLISKEFETCLTVLNASHEGGAQLTLENDTGIPNQRWNIQAIGNSIPDNVDTDDYGIFSNLNTTLIPITPIREHGAIVALQGKMFYPASSALNVSANIKLLWMVNGKSDKVMKAFQANNNLYIATLDENGIIDANSSTVGENETFEWVDLGNKRVALIASNGKYVSVVSTNDNRLSANSSILGDTETFELVTLGGNLIALKADNGKYVYRSENGSLIANATVIINEAKFNLVDKGFSPEIVTLVRYYEDFRLTGCNIQENYGATVGVFYDTDVNKTFGAGFVMAYNFLRSQNSLTEMPANLTSNNLTINNTIDDSFTHSDEAMAALMHSIIPEAIEKLHNESDDETLPILTAVEDRFAVKTMDEIVNEINCVELPLILDISDTDVVTLKAHKINWFNTSSMEPLSEFSVFNETIDWLAGGELNETNESIVSMLNLVLLWNSGESMVTKIGNDPIVVNIPEIDEVTEILSGPVWTSITGLMDITEAIVKHPKAVYSFLKFTMKTIQSVMKALKLTKLVAGIEKILKSISAAQKAISATKSTKFLSTIDKASAWLLVIDLFITAAIAWYIWFSIAISQDWSDYGVALAFLVFYTYVLYSLTIILVGLVFPLLALVFVILDLIFDFFGDFLEMVLGWFTDSYYLSTVELVPEGTPSLNIYDYDQNGMDVGDRIGITSRIISVVKRTRGGQADLDNSYIVPSLYLKVPSDVVWEENSAVVSVETDWVNYRNTTYDLDAWVEPKAMVNFPLTLQLKSTYNLYYKECVWFFGWWCDRESQSGTSTTTLTTLYYDVMPGTISSFSRWKGISVLDYDGDGTNNTKELELGSRSNPWKYDTDGDGLWDTYEISHDLYPNKADTDKDGLGDYTEIIHGIDANDTDTDDDGLTDYEEYRGWLMYIDYYGNECNLSVTSDPLVNDTDGDGLSDLEEYMKNLNPRSYDSDADGVDDINESQLPMYGFITDVDFNGCGSSIEVLPNSTINATVFFRVPSGYGQGENDTLPANMTIILENTTINHTLTNMSSNKTDIAYNSTYFEFNAPSQNGTYILTYFMNWTNGGIVPLAENREIIGVLTVDENATHKVKWECDSAGIDTDGDGITNINEMTGWQVNYKTEDGSYVVNVTSDPKKMDTDGDGLSDYLEHNCYINSTNPRDADTDGDGLTDPYEYIENTDPLNFDTDGDGLDDSKEITFGSSPIQYDSDSDGLNDYAEFLFGSDPNNKDTDADGLDDYTEFEFNSSLIYPDTDNDTLFDKEEYDLRNDIHNRTDPKNPDSDADGLLDGHEYHIYSTYANDNDTDDDGLTDSLEIQWRTDPKDPDSDDDGLVDGDEFFYGTHPKLPDSDFDGTNDSMDSDSYAAHVDNIVLAYDLDQNILEFVENLSEYTNVTAVSAQEFLSHPDYFNASNIVLLGRPDAGNETVGNITKKIMLDSGENVTRMIESDFYRFSVKYCVWNNTQTVVMLSHPYQSDHWIVLNLLKNMRISKYGTSVIAEFPTARDSFIVDTVKDLNMFFWVYLNQSVVPWMNITMHNSSTTPNPLTRTLGLGSNQVSLDTYFNIEISENIQNDTSDIIDHAWIAWYYTAEDLDRNGDGDCTDVGDVKENSLSLYVYNESQGKWVKLSRSMDWVLETGIDTANIEIYGVEYEGYIWANVTHFSLYGLSGITRKSSNSGMIVFPPTAVITISDISGFVNTDFVFDGSNSTDDGIIESYHWDFGDGYNTTGRIVSHRFIRPGEYSIMLTVTDNAGISDTDTADISVYQANNAPSIPVIQGSHEGKVNTKYDFNIVSSDSDNDSIRYHVDWGDGKTNVSEYAASNTFVYMSHQWNQTGYYTIQVYAEDENNALSETVSFVVFVDVVIRWIDDEINGCLVDTEGDGIYDMFYDNKTTIVIPVSLLSLGRYGIDIDTDGDIDFEYDSTTGSLKKYGEIEADSSLLIYIGVVFILLVLLGASVLFWSRLKKKEQKRTNNKGESKKNKETQQLGKSKKKQK